MQTSLFNFKAKNVVVMPLILPKKNAVVAQFIQKEAGSPAVALTTLTYRHTSVATMQTCS